MGAYLNKPKTEITSNDCSNDKMSCGASAMQGWRVAMEDAHTCLLEFDKDTSFFGVFDGHGGAEVAIYAEKHLAEVFKNTDGYKSGDTKQGLIDAFFKLDEDLITEEGLTELKEIAGDNGDDSDNDNETELLAQEATIPLKELLKRLRGACEAEENGSDSDEEEDEKQNGDADSNEDSDDDEEPSNKKASDSTNGESKMSKNDDKNQEEREKEEEEEEKKDVEEDEDIKEEEEKDEKDAEMEENENKGDKEEETNQENDDGDEEDDSESDDDDDDDDDTGAVMKSDEVGYDSGTTAIVALVKNDKLIVANVGDSRCVVCRNGIALEMSLDHKPEDTKELNRIQKAGGKVTGEGRVNGGLNLSRALGDHSYKGRTELKAEEQQITAMPDIRQTELTEADEFMVIACDGIWNVKNSQEVVDFVRKEIKEQKLQNEKVNLSSVCEKLFEDCLAPDTSGDGSGCDNMSCLIITFDNIKTRLVGKRKSQDENENDDQNPDKKSRTDEQ